MNERSYLSNLVIQLNQIGLNEQEIYGTIINSSINESAINKSGYSYSRLLHSNNIVLELSQYKEQIETNVSNATIKKAKLLAINQEQIIEEYINIGFQEDFIEKKDVRNLYTAKQILDRYNFDRDYLATPEQSQKIRQWLQSDREYLEKQKQEKYSNNVFESSGKKECNTNKVKIQLPIEIKKQSIFQKIINKLKNIFKR